MAVHGSVNKEGKGRKVHQKSSFLGAKESTALLGDVGMKAVEQSCQTGDMQYIVNQDTFAVEGKDCHTATQDWNIGHGGQDDSILSAKLIRIVPETSSF
jgi:hypothetical protein